MDKKDTSESGATRNTIDGLRFDLLEWDFWKAMAGVAYEGEKSHGGPGTSGYWKNGFDDIDKDVWNHIHTHYTRYLDGDRSEPHLAKMGWGLMVAHYFDQQKEKK